MSKPKNCEVPAEGALKWQAAAPSSLLLCFQSAWALQLGLHLRMARNHQSSENKCHLEDFMRLPFREHLQAISIRLEAIARREAK